MGKRIFDVVAGIVALVLLSPVMVVVALGVLLSSGRPIMFRQSRAGLGGRPFELFKFRSMRDDVDANGDLLADELRVTRMGRFLRRSRLDELPELFLVISGKMSFVGPRPLPRDLLVREGVLETRCACRPGLTGLAQVSGNTLLDMREKFAVDAYYNAHQSLGGDIAILMATLRTVALGERRDEALIRNALERDFRQ